MGIGEELPSQRFRIDRLQLVRYAGASLDANPIHWSDAAARRAGLPDVIAHGMLTMALAGRVVTDWTGDPGAVVEYRVRFSAPLPVPTEGHAEVVVSGRVSELLEDGQVAVDLIVESDGGAVLENARATVRLEA